MGKENSSSSVKPLKNYQIMCYGLGDLASQFVWTFVGSYLTIFYVISIVSHCCSCFLNNLIIFF